MRFVNRSGLFVPLGSVDWQPKPEVSRWFQDELRQFGDRHGMDLSLSWDGWQGFWTIYNRERVWSDAQRDYEIKEVPFYACREGNGEAMPLSARIFDELDANYAGGTRNERLAFIERRRVEREKRRQAETDAMVATAVAEMEPAVREISDGRSPEDVLGLKPKARAAGAKLKWRAKGVRSARAKQSHSGAGRTA